MKNSTYLVIMVSLFVLYLMIGCASGPGISLEVGMNGVGLHYIKADGERSIGLEVEPLKIVDEIEARKDSTPVPIPQVDGSIRWEKPQ